MERGWNGVDSCMPYSSPIPANVGARKSRARPAARKRACRFDADLIEVRAVGLFVVAGESAREMAWRG